MKKLLSGLLALAFVLSMSTAAFAADPTINQDTPDPKSGNTNVSFNVEPTYTVTIPETVTLDKTEAGGVITYEKDMTITADAGVRLLEGEKIQVTLTSDYTLTVGTTDLPYTVTVGGTAIDATNNVVAEFTTSADVQTSTLHFAAQNPEFAGNYTDTVTFNIAVQ